MSTSRALRANRIVERYPLEVRLRNKETGQVFILGNYCGNYYWWAMQLQPPQRAKLYAFDIVYKFEFDANQERVTR